MRITLLILAIAMSVVACNKTKQSSNRLIKAGDWNITELSVDGTSVDELPDWEIEACEIYEASCTAEWKNDEGGHAEFVWQFRDKGSVFEISRQEGDHMHEHDHATEEANVQCYEFSGVYEVVEAKGSSMHFTSTATLGHAGKMAVLKAEKK